MALRRTALLACALVALSTALYLVAARGAEAASSDGSSADQVARGRELYVTSCAGCHGRDGRGTSQGPTLEGVGAASADFMLTTGRMPLAQPGQAVSKPQAFSPDEIDALVAYVASLGPGPAIPQVDPAAGDLARGGQIYRANCAACHSAGAVGGALSYGRAAPPLRSATAVQIAEAMRIGPGPMPVFGPDTFDDADVDSVVRYVQYLQEPDDPGGLGLGHVGPVTEGLVALVFGVGALLVVTGLVERGR